MSKPIRPARIITVEGYESDVNALFDSGSFYTIVREGCLPRDALILRFRKAQSFGTAKAGIKMSAIGKIGVIVHVEGHDIDADAFVCPDLSTDFIIGAGEMQRWDITIVNENGHTAVRIGRDRNDPDIQTVL